MLHRLRARSQVTKGLDTGLFQHRAPAFIAVLKRNGQFYRHVVKVGVAW